MIGSPAIHLKGVERLLFEENPAEFGMAAKKSRHRVAEQLTGRTAKQRAHTRTDVGHAVVGIDLPQPTHAAMNAAH